MRAVSPVCDVSLSTVAKLLEDAGEASMDMDDAYGIPVNLNQ
jgi:hypothetical protein